jgi:hypothetical protein
MAVIPLGTFINMCTNQQKQKKGAGGRRTVWTPQEEAHMRELAMQVVLGNCSVASCVRMYKQQISNKNTIGHIRPNKSFTAFKRKLLRVVQEMRAEKK